MTPARKARAVILGSCVSRDLLRIVMDDETEVALYVARQSIISCGRPVTKNTPDEPVFGHKFILRNYRSDLAGDGLDQALATRDVDIILIDMVDERHGIYISPDGEVMTRSIDGINAKVYDSLEGWDHLPFGVPAHLSLYAGAAAEIKERLTSAGLFEKAIVIFAPWATHLATGEKTPLSMGNSADWANSLLPQYEQVYSDLGFRAVRPSPDSVVGDPDHMWGPAPFHYVKAFYDSIADQIRPLLAEARTRR